MNSLFPTIDQALQTIAHGWTSPNKAKRMASMILALRPEVSMEVGVYAGKGLVSMALAHKALGFGRAIGVDPYSANASLEGQLNAEDRAFWARLDYDMIFNTCIQAIHKFGVNDYSEVLVKKSDEVIAPKGIGLLRIDGNHGPCAYRDVMRYGKSVAQGGLLILDDIGWAGGSVDQGYNYLRSTGWRELYQEDDGENGGKWALFQKLWT